MLRPKFVDAKPLDQEMRLGLMSLDLYVADRLVRFNLWEELIATKKRDLDEMSDKELQEALINVPSKMGFYAVQAAQVLWELNGLENEMKLWEADQGRPARAELGKKDEHGRRIQAGSITEKAVFEEVVADKEKREQWIQLSAAINRRKRDAAILAAAAKALDKLSDNLQSVGAFRRQRWDQGV